MSTNYYFVNKQSKLEAEHFNEKLELIFSEMTAKLDELGVGKDELLSFGLEEYDMKRRPEKLHIGKRSMGWKPLFEKCEQYSTMQQMVEWYCVSAEYWTIEDEYGEELTWGELEEELINWNGERTHINESVRRYAEYYVDKDGYEWTEGEFF